MKIFQRIIIKWLCKKDGEPGEKWSITGMLLKCGKRFKDRGEIVCAEKDFMIRKRIFQIRKKIQFDKRMGKAAAMLGMLLLTAVFWGKEQQVYAVSKRDASAVTTPEFSWENYMVTAHALGGLDGITYLNSKESFLESYRKGIRLFEVDLARTSDGKWVCRHTWKKSMGQWEEEGKKVLSFQEFMETPLEEKYTPLSLEDLFYLLQDHQDAFVLLDSKMYSVRDRQMTLEDYTEYKEAAINIGAEDVLDQLIPEIYNQDMFSGAADVYNFSSYLYSFWQEQTVEELAAAGDFCVQNGIPAVTVSRDVWTEEIQQIFDERKLFVCVYTVNDAKEAAGYIKGGASGICSDFLSKEDILRAMQESEQ